MNRQPNVTRIVVAGIAIFGGILLLVMAAAGAIVFGPDIVNPPPAQEVKVGVQDGLPGSSAGVEANVEPFRTRR